MSIVRDERGVIAYKSQRTHTGAPSANYAASYSASGEFYHAEPGTLEHWLTARYCLYSADQRGRIYRGEIDHLPWQLASAEYAEATNSMGEPFGISFRDKPHVLFAKPVDVRAWLLRRCDDE